MPTYKNIRIKKKGGGTRLQRVKVLASGKFKFVKNLKKKVTKAAKRVTKRKTTRRTSPKKTGGRKTGKSFLSTQTLFKFFRIGALFIPAYFRYTKYQRRERQLKAALGGFIGYDVDGNFSWDTMWKAYEPYLLVTLLTHGIPKITSMIRRL